MSDETFNWQLTKYLQLMPDLPGLAAKTYVHLTDVMASVLDYWNYNFVVKRLDVNCINLLCFQ